jgi:hypothetical protein
MLEADKQNGMRPVSPRQYKSGGKVHGIHAKKRADRKARKEGGRAMSVDGFINRDNKMANDERAGVKKVGGMKRGGRAHKAMAGAIGDAPIAGAPLAGRPMKGIRQMRPMLARPPVGVAPGMAGKPMMKKGGKVHREHHADGDAVGDLIRQDQIEQGMKGRGLPERIPMPTPRPADKPVKYTGPKPTTNPNTGYKKGGAAHTDEVQDKKLMHKILKPKAFKADGGAMHHKDCSCKMCSGGRTMKNAGGGLYANIHAKQERIAHGSKEHMRKPGSKGAPTADAFKQSAKTAKAVGGRTKHAAGGEAGRGLYVRQGYPHEVPGVDGGRVARKHGGSAKGKTNVNIMIHPHSGMSQPPVMPPMGGPMVPPPPPRPQMPPMGGMPMGAPMGGGAPSLPPMGAARPGMPPIGRKSGGKVEHVIDHAAGGGLGRLEKIKAYGLD